MIRIGLVDLDTSHPKAFTSILKTMEGIEVTALCDGHDVWPAGYDAQFARENNIPTVCSSPEEMLDHVDAAMIHGVDWDKHISKALPFIKAGKHVLIDKPLVGSIADIEKLRALDVAYPSLIFGGSSLRYAEEIKRLKSSVENIADSATVFASGPGDFFSYGIHTTEMLQSLLGAGVKYVEAKPGHASLFVFLTYHNGFTAVMQWGTVFHEWSASVFSTSGLITAKVDAANLYAPFLSAFVSFIKGGLKEFRIGDPLEAVRIHIAAKLSRREGARIALSELPEGEGFDGAAFATEYA
ncbi:MAG: Gfo/Idh/MocA family oxidoreductase, partial [bacterium]